MILLQAAPVNDTTAIIRQFEAATLSWLTVGEQAATTLFGVLATIEMAITFGMLVLSGSDITGFVATAVRKLMTIGAFYALLLLGPGFMQSVINSYVKVGSMASGVPSITAGDMLADFIDICASLLNAAMAAAVTLSPVTSLLLVLGVAAIGWSGLVLVKGFVMAKIESFIVIYAAVIQLGWGALRFTSVYAERYVAAAMASGIKLMVFYFIVGIERTLAPGWIKTAQGGAIQIFGGVIPTLTLVFSIVLFCAIANPEKLTAIIFGGVPQFTGHDITNSYMPWVNTGIAVGMTGAGMITSGVLRGVAAVSSGGAMAATAGGSSASHATLDVVSQGGGGSNGGSRPQSRPPRRPLPPPRGEDA